MGTISDTEDWLVQADYAANGSDSIDFLYTKS
jgi:hypothetical protein